VKGPDISVNDLSYELEGIHIEARGTVSDREKLMQISPSMPVMLREWHGFLLPEETTGGDATLKLTVKDLEFPLVKLPHVVGNVEVRNGHIHVPGLKKTLSRIELSAAFKGNSIDVQLNNLVCGQSVINKGILIVTGLETPSFSLSIDMDRLNVSDFATEGTKGFKIPVIPENSILAKTGGEISLRVKELILGSIGGRDLETRAALADRKINIPRTAVGIFMECGSEVLLISPEKSPSSDAGKWEKLKRPCFTALEVKQAI
jgi:hypothetical protein